MTSQIEPATAYKYVEPMTLVHNFEETFMETKLFFHMIFLDGTVFIWIGSELGNFSELIVSLQTKFDNVASVSTLFGNSVDDFSSTLAQRLAHKFNLIFFVSCNLKENSIVNAYIEKRVVTELKLKLTK